MLDYATVSRVHEGYDDMSAAIMTELALFMPEEEDMRKG